jgi:L-asparaginase
MRQPPSVRSNRALVSRCLPSTSLARAMALLLAPAVALFLGPVVALLLASAAALSPVPPGTFGTGGTLLAQSASDLPGVLVLATGGTISNTEGDRLTGEDLVAELPQLGELARISVEQFSNVASGAITLEQWQGMAARIDELFRGRDDLAGIVITHGTDTMEETAYFLDLTLAQCRPVIVTGAMRRASMAGADGPANLLNSVRLAVADEAREVGAVVLMNDEILPAREVTKVHTSRVNAFVAVGAGPLGVADPDAVVLERSPRPRSCGTPAFDLTGVDELPRVDVVYTYLGADGAMIRSAVEAGARGIVIASVGRGGTTPAQREAMAEARARGVHVVLSSRTGAGRVPTARGSGPDPDAPAGEGAILGAGDLTPQKARVLLMLALTRTDQPHELLEILQTH